MLKLSLLLFSISLASAYIYECLDQCECDTEDEVIHCHNGNRKNITFPPGDSRLRGFVIMGLTYNNLTRLPGEEILLRKFPDLKAIDVERNPHFECESMKEYEKIKIISDCYKDESEMSKVPKIFRPSKDCNVGCEAQRYYDKLHAYVVNLWQIIKEKYANFDAEDTWNQFRVFMRDVIRKLKDTTKKYTESDKVPKEKDGSIDIPAQ